MWALSWSATYKSVNHILGKAGKHTQTNCRHLGLEAKNFSVNGTRAEERIKDDNKYRHVSVHLSGARSRLEKTVRRKGQRAGELQICPCQVRRYTRQKQATRNLAGLTTFAAIREFFFRV